MKKIISLGIIGFSAFCFNIKDTFAYSSSNYENRSLCGNFEVASFDSNGSIKAVSCKSNYNDAKSYMKSNGGDNLAIMTKVAGKTKIIDANLALLDLSVNPTAITYFYNKVDTNTSYTYMDTGSLYGGVDGAHIDTAYSSTKNKWTVKVRIGNYTGWIEQQSYEIVPLSWVKSSSSYTVANNEIRHNYVAKIQNVYNGSGGRTIGPKPTMLNNGKYYSYDGHYFYTSLKTLIKDYKNNNYNNSVNKNNPYYNYYMYLSNHTRTSYSSVNIDEYIRNSMGIKQNAYGNASKNGSSRLYGMGTFFYYAQEKYGVNAVLSLSLSRNETGNGTSNLAINKNNGFGLNAVDSNPTQAANWYASFPSSILGYASKWITYGYAHPRDWRYFGPQFGDKWIGMNVKYASDTYWSEKMAANYYQLDKFFGLQDYNYYQLGVVKGQTNAYQSPSTSSKFIYSYPEAEDGVVIVDEVTSGNEKWYKVVSDLNINSSFNEIKSGNYNWNGYVYVKASSVKKINTGKNGYISPNKVTEYKNKKYEYDLYVENAVLKPKVAITTKNTPYYHESTLNTKTGKTLLKDRYVMVYSAALLNNQPVAYLVTSDYWYDQKEWVSADSLRFVKSNYGKVSVTVSGNQYTWVNYNTVDEKASLISGLYTNSYVPVLEQKTVSGHKWYKVPVSLTDSKHVYGYTLASAPGVAITLSTSTVGNYLPGITAGDKTIYVGESFNALAGVTAKDQEDGDLTSKIIVTKNTVDINKAGTYQVTYQVTDKDNGVTEKTIKVTVRENTAPIINADDITTTIGKTKPSLLENVTASDEEDGNLTNKIKVDDSKVNYDKIGEYDLIYTVSDTLGKTTTKTVKLIVKDNLEPVIYASNKSVTIGNEFNPLTGVTAIDEEDGDITKNIVVKKNDVNINELGDYSVIYEVTDNHKHTVEKEITVTVTNKKEQKGNFHFDYLKIVNNKLQFRGYLTISGMNNTLNEDINYKIIFKDVNDSSKTYEQSATRITDLTGINRPISGLDNYKYTHSWFVVDLDVSSLPNSDYTMEVQAEGKETYSKSLVINKLFKTEVTSYSTVDKNVNIKNNYGDGTSAVTLYVRDKTLPLKTVGSFYNQYDVWRTFEFNNDNLHLKGVSYSFGMNLGKNASVDRKIIFEDKESYRQYSYNLGSITNGLYQVALPENDNLDKTRAWYDANLDIGNLPKGEYKLYISTKSNLVDISEFTDNLGRDLSSKKTTINNKNYQFKLDIKKGNVIELKVE